MSVSPEQFRQAMAEFAASVTVVTVTVDGQAHGMTATAFSSLSLEPPLVLVCVDKKAKTHSLLEEAGKFAINILSSDQEDVSNRFAGRLGPEARHFNDLPHRLGNYSGAPLLDDANAWVDCRLANTYDGGDHTIFVGEVMEAGTKEGRPLVYYKGAYHSL